MQLPRRFRRVATAAIAVVVFLSWNIYEQAERSAVIDIDAQYPLLSKYIKGGRGSGGAWYLPEEWTPDSTVPVKSIIDAAQLALNTSKSEPQRQIPHSTIPRIIHQTWKDTHLETWPSTFRNSAEKWLAAVEDGNTAYLFWDDNGVAQFIRYFESDLEAEFYALNNVERSDVFRILVCKWIGGTYVDMDTEPIHTPGEWITETDLLPWQDPQTDRVYHSSTLIQAIVGIEADCPPNGDSYWRWGYFYPIQLTQWSFAFAPGHPALDFFIDRLLATLRTVARDEDDQLLPDMFQQELSYIDPVNLTGPIAFTDSVRSWLELKADLRWDALSGLEDGGPSKVVDDVLVLPITGFSPGRSRGLKNMGSKPITDPSARLYHHAQGSWRKWSLRVEYGKACRTVFGLCKDWSKVSHGGYWLY
ncbi:hypothetical protein BDW59DRAFT_171391 [Aspergillus cavernicola]|uniref:Glycosyl transferase n=1 Tax=Aspergillus cavernicola TaxID=176166 RepID=A0ABR4II15_9EURO